MNSFRNEQLTTGLSSASIIIALRVLRFSNLAICSNDPI
jgi:hypothetical protein